MMNVWKMILLAIWAPTMMFAIPLYLQGHYGEYLVTFVDYVFFIAIFVTVGFLIGNGISSIGGKVITKAVCKE